MPKGESKEKIPKFKIPNSNGRILKINCKFQILNKKFISI